MVLYYVGTSELDTDRQQNTYVHAIIVVNYEGMS